MTGSIWTTARSRCRTIQVRPVVSASTHGDRRAGQPAAEGVPDPLDRVRSLRGHPSTVGRDRRAVARPGAAGAHSPHRSAQGSVEEVPVQISQLLRHKGREVATIDGAESVRTALALLADKGIGALVVSSDGQQVEGIVSERDVARGLHEHGAGLLTEPVSSVMTAQVHTCPPDVERARPGPAR